MNIWWIRWGCAKYNETIRWYMQIKSLWFLQRNVCAMVRNSNLHLIWCFEVWLQIQFYRLTDLFSYFSNLIGWRHLLLRRLKCCRLTLLFNVERSENKPLTFGIVFWVLHASHLHWHEWNAHIVYFSELGMLAYAETLTQKCEQRHGINTFTPAHPHRIIQASGWFYQQNCLVRLPLAYIIVAWHSET